MYGFYFADYRRCQFSTLYDGNLCGVFFRHRVRSVTLAARDRKNSARYIRWINTPSASRHTSCALYLRLARVSSLTLDSPTHVIPPLKSIDRIPSRTRTRVQLGVTQAVFRGARQRKRFLTWMKTKHLAATSVQRIVRGVIGRKRARCRLQVDLNKR